MKKLMILLLLVGMPLTAQVEKSFPNLTWMNTGTEPGDPMQRFGYPPANFTLVHKMCNNLPYDYMCAVDDADDDRVLLGHYKNDNLPDAVNIMFSPGPSFDPVFSITDKDNTVIWSALCEEMSINELGIIYTAGNINHMFNTRRKFKLDKNGVKEIPQPFHYVGIKGEALKPVTLYSEKVGGSVVAAFPVGYEFEVLLAEVIDEQADDDEIMPMAYLARTSFGLVGWLRLTEADNYMEPVIAGLRYLGD